METRKTVKLADILGKLTPEQSKELASKINGGMGTGKPSVKKPGAKTASKKTN